MSQVSGSGSKLAAVAAAAAIVIWSTNAAAGGAALRGLTVIQVLALQFGGACVTLALARAIQTRREHRASAPVRGRPSRGSIAVAVLGLAGTMTLQYVAFALAPLVAANAIAYSWPLMVAAGVGVTHGSRRPIALAMVGFAGVLLLFATRGGGAQSAARRPPDTSPPSAQRSRWPVTRWPSVVWPVAQPTSYCSAPRSAPWWRSRPR